MTILITRPDPEGSELCSALNHQSISAIHQPLLTRAAGEHFNQVTKQLVNLTTNDIVIAVSQHAVSYTDQAFQQHQLSWPTTINYFAVGQKSAQHLEQVTQQSVHYPKVYDSEHLLALPALQHDQIAGKRVIILRGNGGRELIYTTLSERQADVTYAEVYQRKWLKLNAKELLQSWTNQQVNCIVVTSAEQLNFMTVLFSQHHQQQWLFHCTLLVPSHRVVLHAQQLGYHHITNVGSATNSAMLTMLSNQQ